jgi:hypothetical protein
MRKVLKELLSDENGILSSKRVVAVICVCILCLVFLLESFGIIKPLEDTVIVDSILYIAMVGLFGTSIDKFASRKNTESHDAQG